MKGNKIFRTVGMDALFTFRVNNSYYKSANLISTEKAH